MFKNYLLVIIAIVFFGCASKSIVGRYSTVKKGSIAFAGKEITFNKDQTFILNEWTDSYTITKDESGNQICNEPKGKGQGTYRIYEDSLELNFTNNDFVSCQLEVIEDEQYVEIKLKLIDELSKPIRAATVSIIFKEIEKIETTLTGDFGKAALKIIKKDKPEFLKLSLFAAQDYTVNINQVPGESKHQIKRCIGFYEKNTSLKLWYKLKRNQMHYKKADGRLIKLKRIN